jgi:hypothetical protein
MPMSAKESATTPIPVQVSKSEFNPFILTHFSMLRFEAVLPDVKLLNNFPCLGGSCGHLVFDVFDLDELVTKDPSLAL